MSKLFDQAHSSPLLSPAGPTFSDDLEALHAQEGDLAAEKRHRGTVIQHRSWKLGDVFRSDADQSLGIPSSQPAGYRSQDESILGNLSQDLLTSSPPVVKMPWMSSPVAYPATSSPPRSPSPKRKRNRSPLRDVAANQASKPSLPVFHEESGDESDSHLPVLERPSKRAKSNAGIRAPTKTAPPGLGRFIFAAPKAPQLQSPTLHEVRHLQGNVPASRSSTPVVSIKSTSGKVSSVGKRTAKPTLSYKDVIAARSQTAPGKAKRSYYGIEINTLMDEAKHEEVIRAAQDTIAEPVATIEVIEPAVRGCKPRRTLMWTEKYRARKFTELIGDDRTNRSVMHWLKRWDPIVFPASGRPKSKAFKTLDTQDTQEKPHRKILLLTGPPGLGKTTIAHVCAKQAGYEVQEINASDERSKDVVKGRIRDMVGTENVKGVDTKAAGGTIRKAGRPVCVIVDEVDGVVGGSGGSGEGGFVKALIDLVLLDQRNSNSAAAQQASANRKKKGDNFRMLRPLVLICNDVYHPSLRPLRQSSFAEIVHVRQPALATVTSRMQSIFDKEHVPFDSDGVRRLCEASWGVTSRKDGGTGNGSGEGDIRSIMVVAEWVASRLRATTDPVSNSMQRLSRKWIEENILADLGHGGGAARGVGRGGAKEVVERVFQEGAGFSKAGLTSNHATPAGITGVKGVAEAAKAQAMSRLREMIDTSGDSDRIVTDCFSAYPAQPFQDDNFLTKPDAAYDWLHFHDALSSAVYSSNEWELAPYLSQPVLAFHQLFATPTSGRHAQTVRFNNWDNDADADAAEPLPFTGPQASYAAHEAQKANSALLQSLQSSLSLPLTRLFPSSADLATDLLPYLLRMLNPSVNPIIVSSGSAAGGDKYAATASVRKGSEKALVARAVNAMTATGTRFEKSRIESDSAASAPPAMMHSAGAGAAGWVYRMEPALDVLGTFATGGKGFGGDGAGNGVRYAVRQVLEQELKRETLRRADEARKKRYRAGGVEGEDDDDEGLRSGRHGKDRAVGGGIEDKMLRKAAVKKRDFFGRVVVEAVRAAGEQESERQRKARRKAEDEEGRIWVSFNEGYSNAVRKPVTLAELMMGL